MFDGIERLLGLTVCARHRLSRALDYTLRCGVELPGLLPQRQRGDSEHPEQHEGRDSPGRQPHPQPWGEHQSEHGNGRDQTEGQPGGTGRQPPGEPLERGSRDIAVHGHEALVDQHSQHCQYCLDGEQHHNRDGSAGHRHG